MLLTRYLTDSRFGSEPQPDRVSAGLSKTGQVPLPEPIAAYGVCASVAERRTHGQFGRHALRLNRWFPDHFGYLDEELFGSYLARADTHHVVQPAVTRIIADVGQPANDLSCALWISATIPAALEQNRGAIVGGYAA